MNNINYTDKIPKVSVFTTCKNHAPYLRQTLDSILNQTFKNLEIVLVDGASTDETVSILKEYYSKESRLRWISEPDRDAWHGAYKALKMARGEYIIQLPVTDVFLSKNWIEKCVNELDNNPEISIIHGACAIMEEDGSILNVTPKTELAFPPPSGQEYFTYWLANCAHISELNACWRREVILECWPAPLDIEYDFENIPERLSDELFAHYHPKHQQICTAMTRGYLFKFIPIIASCGLNHGDCRRFSITKKYYNTCFNKYNDIIVDYRSKVLNGDIVHCFRDGKGNVIEEVKGENLDGLAQQVTHYRKNGYQLYLHQDEKNIHSRLYMEKKKKSLNITDLLNEYVRVKFQILAMELPKKTIAVYGAEDYCAWLERTVGTIIDLEIFTLLDHKPKSGKRFWNKTPELIESFDKKNIEAVVLASECFQEKLESKCRKYFGTDVQLINLYERLPSGPYSKKG